MSTKSERCTRCDGSGRVKSFGSCFTDAKTKECPRCDGSGWIEVEDNCGCGPTDRGYRVCNDHSRDPNDFD